MADAPEDFPLLDAAALEHQAQRFAQDAVAAYKRERTRAQELEDALSTLQIAYLETIRSLAFVVEAKDAYTGQHLERCRIYGLALLEAIGASSDYPNAEFGFLLHDVGKVGVPESILNKPAPLTAAEWRVMRTHPTIGAQILAAIPGMDDAVEIVRCHHEMWMGDGYPAGLAREAIPLPARVFQIVDAFDAMTTDRPYRASMGLDRAIAELQRVAGVQFDPDIVAAFVGIAADLPPVRG